ncbi:MAG: SDR family NAD(P)-dependent oxidoreductase [Deltaproteobacteria bacterium]|nr:SDR family NAD(P)-dependent oxidoreductase [Deltaproteobacteria bacterium]MCW5803627.1 SDR family NAD(P)-dependent oxidoreductase [Deltaproteobacteria bacterium]
MSRSRRKFAVISGSPSGIGAELACYCLDNEFDILLCGEDDGLERAAARLAGSSGAVHAVRADLATREGVEVVARTLREVHRPVDALLLVTGSDAAASALGGELEAGLQLIALDCVHVVHLVKRIVPELVARGAGRILITTTSAADGAVGAICDAIRAFASAFGQALRGELHGTGVTVTLSSFDARSSFRAMLAGDELALPRTLTPREPPAAGR